MFGKDLSALDFFNRHKTCLRFKVSLAGIFFYIPKLNAKENLGFSGVVLKSRRLAFLVYRKFKSNTFNSLARHF